MGKPSTRQRDTDAGCLVLMRLHPAIRPAPSPARYMVTAGTAARTTR